MGWRDMGFQQAHIASTKAKDFIYRKFSKGIEEHGITFKGNPLQHAKEETADLWNYLDVIERRDKAIVQLLGEVLTADGGQITPKLGYEI